MTLKVAVVGNSDYYDFFKENQSDWDWQIPSNTINDFYDNLDDNKIDNETPMIIVDPALYDPTGQNNDFESFLAQMAPYALVAVIKFNDANDTTPKDEIEQKVAEQTDNDKSSHIYWLEADDILQSLYTIIEDYVNAGDSSKEVVEKFVNEVNVAPPDDNSSPEETDFDDDEINSVVRDNDKNDDFDFKQESDREEKMSYINTLGKKGTIITVTSAKGGSGKSTVAFSLAQEISMATKKAVEKGKLSKPLKVCLVDGDVYDGQLCYVLGAAKPTMINIAQEPHINQDAVARNMVNNDIVQQSKRQKGNFIGFDALLAPKSPRYVEDTPPDMWSRVLDILTTMYDIVVVDTSIMYFLDPIQYEVFLPKSDKIIYVTDLDLKSILDTTKWMQNVCTPESVSGFGIPLEKVGIVINKGLKEVGMGPKKITKILQVATHQICQYIDKTIPVDDLPVPHVLTTIPSYPKLITGAVNNQNLGAIIQVPELEQSLFLLAQAVVPPEVAKRLASVSDFENKLASK